MIPHELEPACILKPTRLSNNRKLKYHLRTADQVLRKVSRDEARGNAIHPDLGTQFCS